MNSGGYVQGGEVDGGSVSTMSAAGRAAEVLLDWQEQVQECPTGPALAALLAARPDLPEILDHKWRNPAVGAEAIRQILAGKDFLEHAWGNTLLEEIIGYRRLAAHCEARAITASTDLTMCYSGLLENIGQELGLAMRVTENEANMWLGDASRLVHDLPDTLAALNTGIINADVALAIENATNTTTPEVATQVEAIVLPLAPTMTKRSVYRMCTKKVAELDPTGFAKRKKIASQDRGMSRHLSSDGMGSLNIYGPIEGIAAVWHALTIMADAAVTPSDERHLGQRRFDVLVDLSNDILAAGTWHTMPTPFTCTHTSTNTAANTCSSTGADTGTDSAAGPSTDNHTGTGCTGSSSAARTKSRKSATQINVTIPFGTLAGLVEHPGWIDGYGPIDADTARRIAADSTWRRILTDPVTGNILDVGRTRYKPPRYLTEHVQTRDHTCVAPGCEQLATRCHIDHRTPYHPWSSTGGNTSADNLNALCAHHHRAKDGGGCHLTKTADGTYEWTTALGRTYTRPNLTIYEPGDHQTIFNINHPDPTIPAWAQQANTKTQTPQQQQPPDEPVDMEAIRLACGY